MSDLPGSYARSTEDRTMHWQQGDGDPISVLTGQCPEYLLYSAIPIRTHLFQIQVNDFLLRTKNQNYYVNLTVSIVFYQATYHGHQF